MIFETIIIVTFVAKLQLWRHYAMVGLLRNQGSLFVLCFLSIVDVCRDEHHYPSKEEWSWKEETNRGGGGEKRVVRGVSVAA